MLFSHLTLLALLTLVAAAVANDIPADVTPAGAGAAATLQVSGGLVGL
jgi:hypothetical protein